ncbi:hypothetical protein [Clostridium sp. BJN0013]
MTDCCQVKGDIMAVYQKWLGELFMKAIGMVDDHIRTCPYHSTNR